ncbi:MAG: 16S rRNA (uracil(1498)-N(3))-methyltransferase [Alphaproteobacteria bacterium]|nr:16S rRNA (uracil(1498)-N(3))-methyltransferase [Alphaproteobacteria bacterium]
MIRLYLSSFKGQNFILQDTKDLHYLKTVMRLKKGKQILIFNESAGEYLCEILELERKHISFSALKQTRTYTKTQPLQLAFPLIRPNRLSFLLEKATELGVTDLYPILTDHTTHRDFKEERLETILQEASEQCERLDLPKLHPIEKLDDLLTKEMQFIYFDERSKTTQNNRANKNAILIVGPEGGFSEREFDLLEKNERATAHSLGTLILRTETACLKALILFSD